MASDYRLGIDFHGVLNVQPSFFRALIDLALAQGIEIYIISGGPNDIIRKYLNEQNIKYTKLWSVYDYYAANDKVEFLADGSFHIKDELWNKAKGEYCRREKISLHIDDSPVYGKDFATPYCWYDAKNNACKIRDDYILFSTPEDTLEKLLQYVK